MASATSDADGRPDYMISIRRAGLASTLNSLSGSRDGLIVNNKRQSIELDAVNFDEVHIANADYGDSSVDDSSVAGSGGVNGPSAAQVHNKNTTHPWDDSTLNSRRGAFINGGFSYTSSDDDDSEGINHFPNEDGSGSDYDSDDNEIPAEEETLYVELLT